MNRIIQGNSLDVLKTLPDESVHCVVTSPPYYGLRDYGVDGQLGLEKTPEAYIEKMVEVFAEVRRVLRKDGSLWLNMGDSYGTGTRADRRPGNKGLGEKTATAQGIPRHGGMAKQLMGVPWHVAFALQADGWYLRQDIIWNKPNPMPESVRDRCTKAHEYIFLLSKSERYYFDIEAIKEDVTGNAHSRGDGLNPKAAAAWKTPDGWDTSKGDGGHGSIHKHGREKGHTGYKVKQNPSFSAAVKDLVSSRNKRSVWTVATQPFPEAHFATFPEKLIEPCILAGCPEQGIVLDPFMGSGTVAVVARKLNRNYLGIELNPAYIDMAERRIEKEIGLLFERAEEGQQPLRG